MMKMQLISSAFAEGERIPMRYTCDGNDISPPLKWTGVPKGAKALALVCEDPDAPGGTWVHWILYNLPTLITELPEGVPNTDPLPTGAGQGLNDFKKVGYGGPCPPPGNPHRYIFHLYALDSEVHPKGSATKKELMSAMQGHVLAEARLMGAYKRK